MTALPVLVLVAVALAGVLIWLFVSAAFLLWGARIAGIPRRSFGRAFATILLGGLASAFLASLLSAAPVLGTGVGLLLGFCVSAVVMMAIFDTTFGKALAANVLAWVLSILAAAGLVLLAFALLGVVLLITA